MILDGRLDFCVDQCDTAGKLETVTPKSTDGGSGIGDEVTNERWVAIQP